MGYSDDFEEYWKTTAMRNGMRLFKRETVKFWEREIADGADKDDLLRASKAYARHCSREDVFANAKDPQRFISTGLWEDFADIPVPIEMVTVDKEVAVAYWTQEEKPFMLKKLDLDSPPDFALNVSKTFADEYKSDRLPLPVSKVGE